MLDRCYLTESVPVQLVWGEQDAMIPVRPRAYGACRDAGSRLEIFPDSGHYPFHNHPGGSSTLVEFIDTTHLLGTTRRFFANCCVRDESTVLSPAP